MARWILLFIVGFLLSAGITLGIMYLFPSTPFPVLLLLATILGLLMGSLHNLYRRR